MGPSPTYHPPEGQECETSVEHGLPLWAEPAVGYCSRRPRPSPMWGSRFVGARAVGPWVGEQKPLGNSPLQGNPSPESTYLPTCLFRRPVPMGACPHLKPLRALFSECPLVSLALRLPLSFPFLVWWWRARWGGEGALMAPAWGWGAWSHWRRAWGV